MTTKLIKLCAILKTEQWQKERGSLFHQLPCQRLDLVCVFAPPLDRLLFRVFSTYVCVFTMFAPFPWIEYLYVIAYTEHNSVKDLPMCVLHLQCLSPASLNKGRHQSKSGKSCE